MNFYFGQFQNSNYLTRLSFDFFSVFSEKNFSEKLKDLA